VGTTNRNITVNKGDAIDQVERDGLPDWRRSRGYDAAQPRGWAMPWQAWLALIGVPLILGGYLIVRFVAFISELSYQTSWLDVWLIGTLKIALFLSPVASVIILIYWLYLKAADARVIRLQNNMPIARRFVEQDHWQPAALASLGAFYATEQTWAEHSGLRSLNQLDMSSATLPTSKEQSPQLAETIDTVAMLPPAEWLSWFDARPHGLLAAETGGGKSTLFKLITKSRIERGELVFLLDPHSSDWFGLPGIGGGEDWEAIWCGMQVVINEYRARLDAREAYLQQFGREKPVDDFKRITVLLDEANTACRKFSVAKRGEESRWEQFAEALGSGARKVNLSIQLLAQSPNVEDLELSRPMLNNFTRICLDAYTAQLLIQKSLDEKEQKQALSRAIQGQEYPAATTIKGMAVLLDRTGLDRITPPAHPERALWTEGYQRTEQLIAEMRRLKLSQQPARPVVSASVRPSATARVSISLADLLSTPTPDGRTADGQRTKLYLKAMAAAGKTRQYARDRMTALGMPFENSLWTEVRRELGLD
jgi:hypothetical protein